MMAQPSTLDDLQKWVDFTDSCWNWKGSVDRKGYGRVTFRGRKDRSHRLFYEMFIEKVPIGKQIDHLCRNRSCCNPAHLEVVTSRENTLRGESPPSLNAVKTHCLKGHEFTEENTITETKRGRVGRKCRTCMNQHNSDWYFRNRERVLVRQKKSQEARRDEIREYQRLWYQRKRKKSTSEEGSLS